MARNATLRSNWTEINCDFFDEIYEIQENLYWKHIGAGNILIPYGFVCTFGAIANLFVIVSFMKTSHLRNLRNYFIVNLAFSDLTLCVVTGPLTQYFTLNLFWPWGNLTCRVMASVQAVNMFVSCLTLVLIAMDRFLLTLCPVKWRLAATAPIICYLVVWLTSLVVAAPYFFAVSSEDVRMFHPWNSSHTDLMLSYCKRKRPQMCLENNWDFLPFSRRTYTLTVLAIQYVLPLAALGFAYSQIGSTIRKRIKTSTTVDHQKRHILVQRNRKALLLLLFLVLIYGIAWLPINAYNVLHVLDIIHFSQYRYIFCHLIGMTSACMNPIMYGLINDSFRNAFISLLRPLLAPCTKYITVVPPHTHTTHSYAGGLRPHQMMMRRQTEPTVAKKDSTSTGANDGLDSPQEALINSC
ncbi:hypothetical protein QR680_007511 [Steinernema hermaphroditum]|uniref:G-protein coupled receptors family 1 profile domain-containing protein n=1 Tax=Steinernema hermaphroditum TaxID=289476 RepID=A0AA39IFV3_9BILA|nr:hypothetical protein QR680_007511 [Steinernema hermaphroditum]